jgi:hypothetical protein
MVDAGIGHDKAERTTRRDSDRTTSTKRGSLPVSAASATACSEGVTVATSTMRPSDLDTIFCATTSTSPSSGERPLAAKAASAIAARSSPGCTIGTPTRPVIVS